MAVSHLDRLSATDASFLTQENERAHMHIGARARLRGAAAELRRVPRARRGAAAPGAALPAEARLPAASVRAPGLGRRPAPEPRVPRAPLLAARAGRRRPARAADRAHLLPAARPLQAAVGDVARAGARGQPLRADQQDAPRARGRRLGRRPRDRAVRRQPGAGRADAAGAPVGAAARAERRELLARGVEGVAKLPLRVGRRAAARPRSTRARRVRTRSRRPRASARSPGS